MNAGEVWQVDLGLAGKVRLLRRLGSLTPAELEILHQRLKEHWGMA